MNHSVIIDSYYKLIATYNDKRFVISVLSMASGLPYFVIETIIPTK